MDAERSKPNEIVSDDDLNEYSDDDWKKYVEEYFNESKNFRSQRVEKQWMINTAYYKGYQNVKFNTNTQRIQWDTDDPLKFQVNMIYTIVRAIRGAVTKDVPVWEVDAIPYGTTDEDTERYLSQYLSAMYEKLDMKLKTKELVLYGLLYGTGILQYGFDADADNGEGEVWVETFDPFDVYIDPFATGIEDARYVIKVIKRPLEVVKNNPIYDKEKVKNLSADNKSSESPYKELLEDRYKETGSTNKDGTILIKEAWCKHEGIIRVITIAGDEVIRNEETEFEQLPFVIYQPDINPNEIYGEGWVKNLVPLNRALNYLERSQLEFHIAFAKGKYVTDSNSKVKKVTNSVGEIIKKQHGSTFEQLDMKPMSSSLVNQIESINRYMEDVGAAHETFMGRAPTGVTAAIAIEQLVANNMANLVDLLDNLEITLGNLGEQVLRLGYQYYDLGKTFKAVNSRSKEIFEVGGMNSSAPIQLPENPQVKVSIGSGIAHTKGARQELAMTLYQNGLIDRRTLLERYGEDADEIEARLLEQNQGIPISQDGTSMQEMQAMQAPQEAPQDMMQGGEMPPSQEVPQDPEMMVQEFLMAIEQAGLQLSPELQDPEALLAIVTNQLPIQEVNGTIVPG